MTNTEAFKPRKCSANSNSEYFRKKLTNFSSIFSNPWGFRAKHALIGSHNDDKRYLEWCLWWYNWQIKKKCWAAISYIFSWAAVNCERGDYFSILDDFDIIIRRMPFIVFRILSNKLKSSTILLASWWWNMLALVLT